LQQGLCRLFPVQRNTARFGKIISRAAWNDAQRAILASALYTVYRFVGAAIATHDNDLAHPILDVARYLIFEIAHCAAADYVQRYAASLEQLLNPLGTLSSTTAPGRWIDKK
jgi:hypothetical protein